MREISRSSSSRVLSLNFLQTGTLPTIFRSTTPFYTALACRRGRITPLLPSLKAAILPCYDLVCSLAWSKAILQHLAAQHVAEACRAEWLGEVLASIGSARTRPDFLKLMRSEYQDHMVYRNALVEGDTGRHRGCRHRLAGNDSDHSSICVAWHDDIGEHLELEAAETLKQSRFMKTYA